MRRGGVSRKSRGMIEKAKEEFQEVITQEEIKWPQKSRINWLRYGDSSTKFFHSFANCHNTKNKKTSLLLMGYKSLTCKGSKMRFWPSISSRIPIITRWQLGSLHGRANRLARRRAYGWKDHFLRRKLKWQFSPWPWQLTEPQPRQILHGFFQECWEIVKRDIIDLLRDFHSNGKISRGLNSTFITLIPKNIGANRNIRPISLISARYKIIVKVLSNRKTEAFTM